MNWDVLNLLSTDVLQYFSIFITFQQMCADDRWFLAVAFMAEQWGITEHSVYCRVVAVQSGWEQSR